MGTFVSTNFSNGLLLSDCSESATKGNDSQPRSVAVCVYGGKGKPEKWQDTDWAHVPPHRRERERHRCLVYLVSLETCPAEQSTDDNCNLRSERGLRQSRLRRAIE